MHRAGSFRGRFPGVSAPRMIDLQLYDHRGRCLGDTVELVVDLCDERLVYLVIIDSRQRRWLVPWRAISQRRGRFITDRRNLQQL